ncbi:MAG: hypothetical protein IT208_14070 [Chthonomonadales bacterium]|nr:hypothetical protein [Chthonomonadales bacterium]
MATAAELIAYKVGARARKLAGEDCVVEAYELLYGAIGEARRDGKAEMEALLRDQLARFERKLEEGFEEDEE